MLAFATAALAFLSAVHSMGEVWRARSPVSAQYLPFETQAPLLKLSQELQSPDVQLSREEVFPLARRALGADPLNPMALRMMALASDPAATSRESIGYARLADRLSRRDPFVQVILIEEAVRNDNVSEALARYDQALRTNPRSSDFFLPILSEALSTPEIRKGLERYYIVGAPWFETFVSYTALHSKAAAVVDLLFQAGPKKNPALLEIVAPTLLTRLIEQREYIRAERLLSMLPGGGRALLERGEWTAASIEARFGLFAWQPKSSEAGSAGFEVTAEQMAPHFFLYARPGVETMMLGRVLSLRPGSYRFKLVQSINVRDPGARASWKLKCLRTDGEVPLWESGNLLDVNPQDMVAGPIVPRDCRYQALELWVHGGDGREGLDVQMREFRMEAQ